jgi:hypothetical protein
MKKTRQISVAEYASKINRNYFRENKKDPDAPLTEQAIKYRIKQGIQLPETLAYAKIGKVHVITVDINF